MVIDQVDSMQTFLGSNEDIEYFEVRNRGGGIGAKL